MKTVLTIYNRILSVSRHYGPTDSVLWDIVKVSSRSDPTVVKHAIPTSRSRVSKTSIFAICIITTRIRRMGEGNSFNLLVCPTPRPGQVRGGGTPRYLPPTGQGTYPPGQVRWGYPKVPIPPSQGTYPPTRS